LSMAAAGGAVRNARLERPRAPADSERSG
jgi:hypothetical protein